MLRVPDNLLNDEGKRIAKRAGRVVFSMLIGTVLSYVGLLLYLKTAAQPNLTLIEIWFHGTKAVLFLGTVTILVYLNRTLPRYQISGDVNDRPNDSI